jgi:hypothetical protein
MKKAFHIAFSVILLASGIISYGFVSVGNHTAGNEPKITICHTPPGNPGNCHEIEVSLNALQAHLDHGDALVCHHPEELETYEMIAADANVSVLKSY